MRVFATLIIIAIVAMPTLLAGLPSLSPVWFDGLAMGVPQGVLFMSGLLVVLVVLATICSAAARRAAKTGEGAQ